MTTTGVGASSLTFNRAARRLLQLGNHPLNDGIEGGLVQLDLARGALSRRRGGHIDNFCYTQLVTP